MGTVPPIEIHIEATDGYEMIRHRIKDVRWVNAASYLLNDAFWSKNLLFCKPEIIIIIPNLYSAINP
jgi:hypothetical protein